MNKNGFFLMLCVVLPVSLWAGGSKASESGKLAVSVSFDALREFTVSVGGDLVDVKTIIPAGTEPHDFEPKARDLAALSTAKIFVYNGLGMEGWAEEALGAVKNRDLVVVRASDGADFIRNTDPEEVEEHGEYDPHLWLSLKGAQAEVKNICAALVRADPANRGTYEQNAADYTARLERLYAEYKEKFSAVPKKSFVTGHAAFGYLCREFGLEQNSVEDMFAEGEPSPRQMAELVDFCRANKVTVIFAEEMASPDVSRTLANEVGARVETIYTIESAEDGMSYLERMEENLKRIHAALTG
jgi:zinc transport system substrate-binding protein